MVFLIVRSMHPLQYAAKELNTLAADPNSFATVRRKLGVEHSVVRTVRLAGTFLGE